MRDSNMKKSQNQIRPAFTLYHPNQKGTGSALALRVVPAVVGHSGYLQVEISRQQTIGDVERKVSPTFNWKDRLLARLSPIEVGELVCVLLGKADSLRDGKGFRHQTDGRASSITCGRAEGDSSCYKIGVSIETIAGEERNASIVLSERETFAIGTALSASMGTLCFG